MTTSFDQIFEQLEAPEYPATCDNCGLVGTNASMVAHECADRVTTLVATLRDELEAIRIWQSARGVPADVRDGLQISAEKIRAALAQARS